MTAPIPRTSACPASTNTARQRNARIVAIKAAQASRPVRQTKTLPPTLAERFAQVAARLASRSSSQSATSATPPRRRLPRPGW